MSFFKMLKPGTATILSAVLLFVVIASIFFSVAFTVGEEKSCSDRFKEDYPEYYADLEDGDLDDICEKEDNQHRGTMRKRIMCGVFLSTFSILGIIGNILSIIVFTRPSMRTDSNLILSALGIFDSIYLLIQVIQLGLGEIVHKKEYGNAIKFVSPITHPVESFLYIGGMYTMVLLTVVRYIAICHRDKAHLVSRGKIKIYIGCILCFSFVWNFPKWFALEWVKVKGEDSQDELHVQDTAMGLSDSYKDIYLTGLEKIVLEFVIPLATLTVLNILLLKMVIETKSTINNLSSTKPADDSQERKLTIMIIVIVGVFFLCNIPDCIWWIIESASKSESESETFICFSVFTHTLNCTVNVIIYASFGKKFQQTFFELFCAKFQEEQVKKERSAAGTPIPLRTTITRKTTVQSETMANTSPA